MDKIRILWIDDRHQEGLPEPRLPEKFRKYFKIVDPRPNAPDNNPHIDDFAFRNVDSFIPILQQFWFANDTTFLPCEILATDYDLSRFSAGSDEYNSNSVPDDAYEKSQENKSTVQETEDKKTLLPEKNSKLKSDYTNYDGLVINTIFSCLTYQHPSALVSMTSLMDEMPSSVKTLHKMAEPFVGVDFEQNLDMKDRSWEKIIEVGLKHLRNRIEALYESGHIVISPNSLMTLIDKVKQEKEDKGEYEEDDELTITSVFTTRHLPLLGLFIDVDYPELDKSSKIITEWLKNLFGRIVKHTDFKQAEDLANQVWTVYNGEDPKTEELFEERQKLSLILSQKDNGLDIEEEELTRLASLFEVDGKDCNKFSDIRSDNYPKHIQRWAVLLIIFRLIKRMVHCKKNIFEQSLNIGDPKLTEDDIWLALFPLPKNPLKYPKHDQNNRNRLNNWVVVLKRLELNISHVLNGEEWNADGPYGLQPSERFLLRGLASSDKEMIGDSKLEESLYFQYTPARLLLWGKG